MSTLQDQLRAAEAEGSPSTAAALRAAIEKGEKAAAEAPPSDQLSEETDVDDS